MVLVTFCGVLLLLAQIQVRMRQRRQELVVCRTLGAGKKLLRATLWWEFALLGVVAGVVAALGAEAALWALQRKIFDFPWQPDWTLWLALPLCGAEAGWACGCCAARRCSGALDQHKKSGLCPLFSEHISRPGNAAGVFRRQHRHQRFQRCRQSRAVAVGQVKMADFAA